MSKKTVKHAEGEEPWVTKTIDEEAEAIKESPPSVLPEVAQLESKEFTCSRVQQLESAIAEHKTLAWKLHGKHRPVDLKLYAVLEAK